MASAENVIMSASIMSENNVNAVNGNQLMASALMKIMCNDYVSNGVMSMAANRQYSMASWRNIFNEAGQLMRQYSM